MSPFTHSSGVHVHKDVAVGALGFFERLGKGAFEKLDALGLGRCDVEEEEEEGVAYGVVV